MTGTTQQDPGSRPGSQRTSQDEACIHPGVFASPPTSTHPDGQPFEHCWSCNTDVPQAQL